MTEGSDPQHFWHQDLVSWKTFFPWTELEDGSGGDESAGK